MQVLRRSHHRRERRGARHLGADGEARMGSRAGVALQGAASGGRTAMTPEPEGGRLESLFEQASTLEEPERSAFLDAMCAGDTELRAELEAMLGAREHASDWLDSLAASAAESLTGDLDRAAPPERLFGAWRAIRELGRG